jgi:hypothetical protein
LGRQNPNQILKDMAKKDTKKDEINPKATPKVKAQKAKPVVLEHSKRYNFESNGKAKTMSEIGKVFVVSGQVAESLINRGFGKIV